MEAEENHVGKRSRVGGTPDGAGGAGGGMRPGNHPASRIYRVSRASGGKDRHSKVYTEKGLRDRRVRLSVSTAIQFYDLQDRLGYDQPSKAVEWLINAAAAAISELPTLESSFPEHMKGEMMEHEVEPGDTSHNQHLSLTKSGCSSTSETSRGSVLTLSRSESRVKARERARSRAAKDKEGDDGQVHHKVTSGLNAQSSFTELLTGGGSNGVPVAQMDSASNSMQMQSHYLPITTTADYFAQAALFGQPQKAHQPLSSLGFTTQAHPGNSSPIVQFNISADDDHPEMHQFSFLQDHPGPLATVTPGDHNLNFSISSGLAGFNRGTLQSNSPSQLHHQQQQQHQHQHHHHHYHHHLQRLSSQVDGSNLPFFFNAASLATSAAAPSAENQFPGRFDGRLQLSYGDGYRHLDLKGKEQS